MDASTNGYLRRTRRTDEEHCHKDGTMRMDHIPSPLLGLGLGIIGLCVALEHAFALHGVAFYVGCVIATPLFVLVSCKFALRPRILAQELGHPVLGAIPGAGCMVVLQLSQALAPLWQWGAEMLWLLTVPVSIALPCLFYWCRWRKPDIDERLPSWFLILGGMLMCAPTVPRPEYAGLANAMLYVGDIIFFAVLPPVFSRAIRRPQTITDAVRPVLAIFAAPVSLVIVTWLNSGHGWGWWGWPVYALALALTLWVYTMLPRLLRMPFSPAKASLTFPMAISATASHKMAAFAPALKPLAMVETAVAVFVVGVVCWQFARAYCGVWLCHSSRAGRY